jgi:hypothetical protein
MCLYACLLKREPEDFSFFFFIKNQLVVCPKLKLSTSIKFAKIYQHLRIQRNEMNYRIEYMISTAATTIAKQNAHTPWKSVYLQVWQVFIASNKMEWLWLRKIEKERTYPQIQACRFWNIYSCVFVPLPLSKHACLSCTGTNWSNRVLMQRLQSAGRRHARSRSTHMALLRFPVGHCSVVALTSGRYKQNMPWMEDY